MSRFATYSVLITGVGQGIGEATARRCAAEGAQVLVTDRDPSRAQRVAEAIRSEGGSAEPYGCDVADPAAEQATVEHAVDRFGALGVLVNNAYASKGDPVRFEDHDDAAWCRDFDVCLRGACRCIPARSPGHLVTGSPGPSPHYGRVSLRRSVASRRTTPPAPGPSRVTRRPLP